MKKLRQIFGISILILIGGQLSAQVLDGVYVKEHVPARKFVPYNYLREADMMYTKRIWRKIDMKEKINHPLYYPTGVEEIGSRMSFINLILRSWRGDFATTDVPRITLYDSFGNNDNFATMIDATEKEVIGKINSDAIDTLTSGTGTGGGPTIDWESVFQSTYQVIKLLVKEDWYFDKQRSKLEVRIIGICPIIEIEEFNAAGDVIGVKPKKLFWIYFPEARNILANHEVFNPYNDAERRTFDDIFYKRHFSSYIEKEANVFNNRMIADYKSGLDALLESERIKESMFKVEHDLWEY